MARAGNHGQVIPRDRRLLWSLYWEGQHSLPSIARMYGVTHKSVERVFRQLEIPRRKRHTAGQSRFQKCVECGKPVHKIKHASNGAVYGKRCLEHHRKHYAALAKEYIATRDDVKQKRRQYMKRWYEQGPSKPKGEDQWIRKSKHLLRSVKRLLQTPTHEASASPSVASEPERTLRE